MGKYKSLKYWISNFIMSFGISFVMSIFAPLLQGAPVLLVDVLKFTLYTGIISMIVTSVLPLDLISEAITHIITKKENRILKDIIYSFILTFIMSVATLIILDHLQIVYWISLGKVFILLVIIAYGASLYFKRLDKLIIGLMEKKDNK